MLKKIILIALASLFIFTLPAYADNFFQGQDLENATFDVTEVLSLDGEDQDNKFFNEESGYPPIVNFILTIINFFVNIMGSLAILLFIIAGLRLIFNQGNQQNIDGAKEMVKYAIFGLIATFLSYTMVITIQAIFDAA